ncbi:HAEPLYID family protein [Sphingobacterium sp. CZ-UAM]|uniref:HAEPLYID family protein n=1 Tax=Sphingobacterium sp. CZ-UAM TaxID=1933868 RepID=UPI000984C257|nr:HAEPLYID family protein [Sphingobacterium sp. CZ-UAM]
MKNNNILIQCSGVFLMTWILSFSTIAQAQESRTIPDKVHHAEPLYNDLVRDLGARKGEKEFNIGADITRMRRLDEYGYLMEYEFAPIDRLGLEVETDFAYSKSKVAGIASSNELERLRLSSQYSFYVSKKHATTLAVGYTQIFNFVEGGTAFNPFFVAAKSWYSNWHTLVYTGPEIAYHYKSGKTQMNWQINTSFHYTLPQTDHFIGLEVNQQVESGCLETTLRPQVKLGISDKLAIGMAVGFPVGSREETISSFFRLIYQL